MSVEKIESICSAAELKVCAESLHSLASTLDSEPKMVLDRVARILLSASNLSRYSGDNVLCERLLKLAVAHAVRLGTDEMAVYLTHPGTSHYYRQLGFKPIEPGEHDMTLGVPHLASEFFITTDEAEGLWTKFIDGADEIVDYHGHRARKTVISGEDAIVIDCSLIPGEVIDLGKDVDPENDSIVVKVSLTGDTAAIFNLGKKLNLEDKMGTTANLNRYTIWLDTVRSGNPFYRSTDGQSDPVEPLDPDAFNTELTLFLEGKLFPDRRVYERFARRRILTALNLSDADLEQHRHSLEDFYLKTYSHHHPDYPPKVILARSGNAANMLAARLINATAGEDKIRGYIAPGWYWESTSTIRNQFSDSGFIRSQVVFLNAEPNTPGAGSEVKIDWKVYCLNTIQAMVEKAAGEPEKTFYLVVDRTACLNWYYQELVDKFPKNLILIETASLTKHQRGEKNHFSGVCWIYAPDSFVRDLDRFETLTTATLDTESLVFFPKITPSEIDRNIETVKSKMAQFKMGFETAMRKLPKPLRWQVETHNYYCYVEPPLENLDRIFRHNFYDPKKLSHYDEEFISEDYYRQIYEIYVNDLLLELFVRTPVNWVRGYEVERYGHGDTPWKHRCLTAMDELNVPEGNSFGLQESVYTSYHYWSIAAHAPVNFIRLCPGIDRTENIDFYKVGAAVAEPVIESMSRLRQFDYIDEVYATAMRLADDLEPRREIKLPPRKTGAVHRLKQAYKAYKIDI